MTRRRSAPRAVARNGSGDDEPYADVAEDDDDRRYDQRQKRNEFDYGLSCGISLIQ
jgi:hypothetical protein